MRELLESLELLDGEDVMIRSDLAPATKRKVTVIYAFFEHECRTNSSAGRPS